MRLDILLLLSFLVCIIGLLACSPPPNPTPTIPPTLLPSVTLTIYNPMFITTLTPNSLPSATILPSISEFSFINISPPLCYPSEFEQITCLGYVENQSSNQIADVTLQATFLDSEKITRGQIDFTLEQRTINAGDVAPYRIQIPDTRLETNILQIEILSAQITSETLLQLRLIDMQGAYDLDNNQYTFTAELENPTAFDASQTRLIITLENEDADIIGFRVADIPEDIKSGSRVPVLLHITPLEATTTIRHRITLEAFPSENSALPEG